MKILHVYLVVISMFFAIIPFIGYSQKSLTANEFALVLANRMKDSLLLDDIEYEQIHETNRKIQAEFIKIHSENKNVERNVLQKKLGAVERKRDEWYEKILSEEKFKLYLTKKANLFKLK